MIRLARFRDPLANGLGIVIPAILAVALTPYLVTRLGHENFGVFSLQLAACIILGINDFGISRAVVLVGIARGGADDPARRGMAVRIGLQLACGLALGLLVPLTLLGVPALLALKGPEIAWSSLMMLMAAGLSLLALPLRASLEIERRFVLLNLIRGVASGMLFGAPAFALHFADGLIPCAAAVLVSRLVVLAAFTHRADVPLGRRFLLQTRRVLMVFRGRRRLPPAHRTLMGRAGWLGIAGVASTVLGYVDRFVVGALAGAAAVTPYAVAAELATKIWLIMGAFSNAETPRVAASWDPDRRRVTGGALAFFRLVAFGVSAMSFLTVLFAGDAMLGLWLGDAYRPEMGPILRLLTFGIAVNCLTQVNYLLLIVSGRERQGAVLQLIVLPLTLAATAAGVMIAGPVGAAAVFALRLTADAVIVRLMLERGGASGGIGLPALAGWTALLALAYALWAVSV